MIRLFLAALCLTPILSAQRLDLAAQATAILHDRCYTCHGPDLAQSSLRLNTREATLKGGNRGPAIAPAQPASSLLIAAVKRTGDLSMPPGPKLSDSDISTLENWIAAGAQYPKSATSSATTEAQTWWSFRKPVRPAVPGANNPWVRTPIDAFIAAKLTEHKLKPAPEADRRTLIRRATLDLHGLPPSAEEIEKFVNDPDPNAYDKLIDQLLASPRYGEKWGRHWLDLARYGDTAGFEQDPYLLYAWRFRDYVIDSFNSDKPYDRFIKEQIAGDELYPDDPAAQTGTGFYTVGPNRDMLYKVEDINRVETLTDWVDTTGSVFLGLSVGCARCHDHKFDPIPQRDYYALQAIFQPAEKTRIFLQYDPARGYDLKQVGRLAQLWEIADRVKALSPDGKTVKPDDQPKVDAIKDELYRMFKAETPGPFAPGIHDAGREGSTRAWLPGRSGRRPEPVPPGFLTAIGGGTVPEPAYDATTSGNRTALANWIATKDNPLTARVIVNRIWQYHFGQGLMASPSDFGHRGGMASHPELLDWLATEFMENGWSMKKLHKLIMTSSVYRESAEPSKEASATDAGNLYISHYNRRRLMPEEIRDAMLESSGALNLKMYGRPVIPAIAKEELYGLSGNNMWQTTTDVTEHTRRSVYMFVRRTFRPAMFETFDAPEGIQSCSRRAESNTAPQSLTLLNGQWTVQEAKRLAERFPESADDNHVIAGEWLAIYGHAPNSQDVTTARTFLERQTAELGSRKAAAAELARVLFNTNEFLYVN